MLCVLNFLLTPKELSYNISSHRNEVRTDAVKALIKMHGIKEAERNNSNYDFDRSAEYKTKLGYTEEQFTAMSRYGLENGTLKPENNFLAHSTSLIHLFIVLSSSTMARCWDLRESGYADLQLTSIDNLPCLVYGCRTKTSKGCNEYLHALPHADPFKCVFFAIGLMLFT